MQKEAKARIKINSMLEKSGWRFFTSEDGKPANIQLEEGVMMNDLGDDFEKTKRGSIDYLLLDGRGFPLCVLEAKKESIHPLSAKEQARQYAASEKAQFIILSNGVSHYLWDFGNGGNPEIITEFPTQESLERRAEYKPNTSELSDAIIDEKYLAPVKTLRPYQVAAIQAIQASARNGKTRYLLEMATGTWKTTTSAAICKLFLKTGNAKRILFLVDRIELEEQARKSFADEIFKGTYFCNTVKSGEWRNCEIVVSTIQTLMACDRYKELFSPTDFELVISDEAHRSVNGNARAIFEYFIGYKLGLTATPKDYLKGVDEQTETEMNPKAIELRNLRDTYKTFWCESGEPTYRYDLLQGVKDGFLINPFVIDARTEVTTELLSEEGYNIEVASDDGKEAGTANLKIKGLEKKFVNEDTNRVFAETIIKNGFLDPITGEFWKMLVFCVSQEHAAKITQLLNEMASQKWPGKYSSDFAMQITSSVARAQEYTQNFTNNRLSGRSTFAEDTHPDYETGKTRVCVTVGMMTTGYDCPDLLGVALLRPVFSPADFVQMKGRGTRKCDFIYKETGEKKKKEKFLLIDFFWNCEYFEKTFNYDKKLDLPKIGFKPSEKDGPTENPAPSDLGRQDRVLSETVIHIGSEGMKIDSELYRRPKHEQFEYVMKNSKTISDVYKNGDIDGVEEFLKSEVFQKPTEYWNSQSLRESYEQEHKTGRKISLREMILKALGFIKSFQTREERLENEWQKFLAAERENIDSVEQTGILKDFFETYLADREFREIIDSGDFARLDSYPSGIDLRSLPSIGGTKTINAVQSYSHEYLHSAMAEFSI